jgi:hypothetical protein
MPDEDIESMKAAAKAAVKKRMTTAKPQDKPVEKKPEQTASPKPEPPPSPQKEDIFGIISSILKFWWAFIQKDFKAYYFDLLKVNIANFVSRIGLTFLFYLILFTAALAVISLNLVNFTNPSPLLIPLALVGVVFIVLSMIFIATVTSAIQFTAITLTDARLSGKSLGMGESFNRIKGRTFRFVLLNIGIWIVLSLPALVIMALPFLSFLFMQAGSAVLVSTMGFMMSMIFVELYLMLVLLLYAFFLQFWVYGFLIDDLPVREALTRSYRLVRSKPFEVLIFDIVLMAISMIVSVPFTILFIVFYLVLWFLMVVMIAMPVIGLVLLAFLILAFLIIALLCAPLMEMVMLPITYLFWKRIKAPV